MDPEEINRLLKEGKSMNYIHFLTSLSSSVLISLYEFKYKKNNPEELKLLSKSRLKDMYLKFARTYDFSKALELGEITDERRDEINNQILCVYLNSQLNDKSFDIK